MIREAGLTATIVRPWYVLGPGHWWPKALVPLYKLFEAFPPTRATAQRLGLITIEQMVTAIVQSGILDRPGSSESSKCRRFAGGVIVSLVVQNIFAPAKVAEGGEHFLNALGSWTRQNRKNCLELAQQPARLLVRSTRRRMRDHRTRQRDFGILRWKLGRFTRRRLFANWPAYATPGRAHR